MELTAGSPPLSFPADFPATASLADGPVLDLNVMTRRGVVEHAVDRLPWRAAASCGWRPPTALVFCRSGSVEVAIGDEQADVGADDYVLVEPSPAVPWALRAQPSAIVFLIRLAPRVLLMPG